MCKRTFFPLLNILKEKLSLYVKKKSRKQARKTKDQITREADDWDNVVAEFAPRSKLLRGGAHMRLHTRVETSFVMLVSTKDACCMRRATAGRMKVNIERAAQVDRIRLNSCFRVLSGA